MGEIQSFAGEHAPGVARLYMRAVRGQQHEPSPALGEYFRRVHLENPWATPEIPSLVYVEDGEVVGTLGVMPRTVQYRGQAKRLACMTLFMVDPDRAGGHVGVQLLGRFLKGPQDLSWTDGASGPVTALWSALGGYPGPLYGMNWIRVLRPVRTAQVGVARLGRLGQLVHPLVNAVGRPIDALLARAPGMPLRAPTSALTRRSATPDELLAHIERVGWREKLHPVYEAAAFRWLLHELSTLTYGTLRCVTVSSPAGEPVGWFVYLAVPDGASLVFQIGARRREDFRDVFGALLADAWALGSACVKGSAIPQYLTAMTEMHCIFRHPYDRVVVHSRTPELATAVRTGEAAMTRLDGNGWLRFSSETWR